MYLVGKIRDTLGLLVICLKYTRKINVSCSRHSLREFYIIPSKGSTVIKEVAWCRLLFAFCNGTLMNCILKILIRINYHSAPLAIFSIKEFQRIFWYHLNASFAKWSANIYILSELKQLALPQINYFITFTENIIHNIYSS